MEKCQVKEKIFHRFFKKIDIRLEIGYNIYMDKKRIAIIGGGAAGLFLANLLTKHDVVLFERGERLGKKLSSTGNGQGNITNLSVTEEGYFSVQGRTGFAEQLVKDADNCALEKFFKNLGVVVCADERGRVYPAGRQASSLTDALRFSLSEKGAEVYLSTHITDIEKKEGGFLLTAEIGEDKKKARYYADAVVLCCGGKAAKNFGTDGSAYALAEKFGHTVTPLYPSLVQFKTDTVYTKTLKGIRVMDGGLTARTATGEEYALTGDIIFTDYGVSGDAVFRVSAFVADKISKGVTLEIDFLPHLTETEIYETLQRKRKAFPSLPDTELLFGIVNNQVGRAILKRAQGDLKKASSLVKRFGLNVTGSLGFDYAQVTKGGIPLAEITDALESKFVKGLYFAGEILDVDGQCGGYNLQWAFSSAYCVAKALERL